MSMLDVDGVVAGYGAVRILHGVSLSIGEGEVVAVVGPNGAGKTTLLSAISGLASVFSGTIRIKGQDVRRVGPAARAAMGVVQVPENRLVFGKQTVEENFLLGGYTRRREGREVRRRMERLLEDFPNLAARRRALAGTLSGGEQQMLAIGMALMAKPAVLMLDEPSLGLAPLIVDRVYEYIDQLKSQGTTMLLVEQNVERALEVADRAIVLHLGRVLSAGLPHEVLASGAMTEAYQVTAGVQE
jgi:branched-chain amino acid transport system ATP-binding protein